MLQFVFLWLCVTASLLFMYSSHGDSDLAGSAIIREFCFFLGVKRVSYHWSGIKHSQPVGHGGPQSTI